MTELEKLQSRLIELERWVRFGKLDQAEPALRSLLNNEAVSRDAQKLLAVCRQLRRLGIIGELERYQPQPSASGEESSDPDFGSESGVLISHKVGAGKTVVVFTGNTRQIWISLHLWHRFLSRYDCNVIYLRDVRKRAYLSGIAELGADYDTLLASLSALTTKLGALSVYCLGSSAGGYMALRAGVDLGAKATLAFAPRTSRGDHGVLPPDLDVYLPDIRDLYLSASDPPRTTLVFGEINSRDNTSSRHLAGLPSVWLHPLADYSGHDVVAQSLANGSFPLLIDDFLRDAATSAFPATQKILAPA